MDPQNHPIENENHFPNVQFGFHMIIFGCRWCKFMTCQAWEISIFRFVTPKPGGHSAVGVPLPFRAVTEIENDVTKAMAWKTLCLACEQFPDGHQSP